MRDNPINPTVPLYQNGIHHGHLQLPHSRDDSAWGSIMIPITVVRNGDGPTALLTGANHGDEYEGPLALVEMAQTINLDDVSGRIIIVPFMNYPAFRAGTRTSPIDSGNMNRSFPGVPDGTVTQKIADYFQRTLLSETEFVLDFHSGGKTLDFLPLAASHVLDDKDQEARCRAARDAFNAPWSVEMREIDSVGMYDDAAEAMGKTFVTTELGGGGSARPETVAIARKGVRNFLKHAGILAGALDVAPTRHITQPEGCFTFAPEDGMIEPMVELGASLKMGDPLARIWPTGHTGRAPLDLSSPIDGLLIARHFPGLVQAGDCVGVMGVEVS